jgi:hypothetical protein
MNKFKLWIEVVLLAVLVGGGFYAWQVWYSPEARKERALSDDYSHYEQAITDYASKEKADTYGGKTPEETIGMFTRALGSGDIDLASKYFALEKDMSSPDYLTRHKIEKALQEAKASGRLPIIMDALKKMQPAKHKTASPKTIDYVSLGEDGVAEYSMTLEFNEAADIWKIETL